MFTKLDIEKKKTVRYWKFRN